jgi:glycosyltransferase involved in cell wall biosynthesis
MSKITVITSSRNREEFLNQNIEHVSKVNLLKEHLIIDFDSTNKIDKSKYENDKVKILNVVDEPEWSITRSYNVGIQFSSTEYTMKIDADILIDYDKFNTINFVEYDILYFIENEWDPGSFIAKTSLLKDVNGFNEFIKSRFDDHDLLKRIEKEGYKIGKIPGLVKEKKDHSNDLRHSSTENYFKNNANERFSYAVVKAHNDGGAYISSLNLWKVKYKLDYLKLENEDIKISHPRYYEKIPFFSKLRLKYIYLKTFFTIFYSNKNSVFFAVLKRISPLILWLLPLKINEKIVGVKISS